MIRKLLIILFLSASLTANAQKYTARDSITVDSIMTLAMHAYYQDIEQSLEYTKQALAIARVLDYKKGICEAYNGLGIIYTNIGMTDSGEYYTRINIDARFALKNQDDSLGAYIDMLNLSSIYSARGQIVDALKMCKASMDYADKVNDTQCMVQSRSAIGALYLKCEEMESAKPYFLEILQLIRNLKFQQARVEIGSAYLSLSRVFILSKEYEDAIIYLDSAEIVFEEIKDSLDLVNTYITYAEAYFNQGKYEEGYPYAKEAFRLSTLKSNAYQNSISGYYLCQYYREKDQFDSALYYGKISYEQTLKIENANILKSLYLEMGKIYSAQGDYEEASRCYEKHIALDDSLYNESLYRELQAQRFNDILKKEQKEVEKIEEDNKDKAATIYIWKIAGTLLFITKVALIILAVSLYRRRKKYKTAIKELAATNQIKNRLLAIISHDLRSPLSSLYSVISLTKQNALSDEEKERLYNKLEQNLNITLALVDNLLYWTKNQINEIKPEFVPFHINKKLENAVDVYEPIAKEKGITIVQKLNADMPVYGDNGMMNIVVRNLLSNAIKYTNKGGSITLSTEIANKKIRVSVQDTGIGMDEKKLETIFTSANKSELGTKNEKGTGLGLLVSFDFVKMNNSELKVTSELGVGTTFYFDLPLANE